MITDQVKDVAKARDGLGDEEEDDDADAAEQATLPVEIWNKNDNEKQPLDSGKEQVAKIISISEPLKVFSFCL